MNIVKQNLFEFTRNSDPLDTLGIGYAGKIHKFFDDLGVDRDDYNIKDKQITFYGAGLYLNETDSLIELPDNIKTDGYLSLENCINLVKLPNNLYIGDNLYLTDCTKLVELPDDIVVKKLIYVSSKQTELINWINNSRFKYKLYIR